MKDITPEMVEALRKPLPEKAITQHPTKTYLSSIKPPYVIERLNEVFGLNGWRDEYEVVSTGTETKASAKKGEYKVLTVVVKGRLEMPEYGIVRTAYGGNDQEDFGDAYKGACTDALTKMAMMVYIGMDVYKGLGAKSEYKADPAKKSDYQTIEGLLLDKKTDEFGYWFKIGERAVFKDEASPVDASVVWNAPLNTKFRLQVIERKRAEKTFYELVDVLGEPVPPQSTTTAPTSSPKPEPTLDPSVSQEAPKAILRTIMVTSSVMPKAAGKPFIIEGFDAEQNEYRFSSWHKSQYPDLLTASGKECELLVSRTEKAGKVYWNVENWVRIGTRKNDSPEG